MEELMFFEIPEEYENKPMDEIPLQFMKKKSSKQENKLVEDFEKKLKINTTQDRQDALHISDAVGISPSLPEATSAPLSTMDANWKYIFEYKKYDGDQDLVIDADEIRKILKTKPSLKFVDVRNLCKQDFRETRPKIFKENNLSIIPIKNGIYLITKENIYFEIRVPRETNFIPIKRKKISLLMEKIENSENENTIIDYLYYSNIFERTEILGEKILYGPLLRGRRRCSFKMNIGSKELDIKGVQIETDGVYETENKILVLECKCGNLKESFNVKQLYFPYRYIDNIYQNKKKIIPIFVAGKLPDVYVWKFEFKNLQDMTSIYLENVFHFRFF